MVVLKKPHVYKWGMLSDVGKALLFKSSSCLNIRFITIVCA